MVSGSEICGIYMAVLMGESVAVSLSQWIRGAKNVVIKNIVLIGLRDGSPQAENQSESYSFHRNTRYYISFAAGTSGGGKANCLPVSVFGQSGHSF